jgi:integrase
VRLTNTAVAALALPATKYAIYRDSDLRGFGVWITSGGVRSYFVERMVDGKNVRATIGRHGEITATEARAKAQATLAQMSAGINPTAAKKESVAARKAVAMTFGAIAEDYITLRLSKRLKESTAKDYRRDLAGALAPIAGLAAESITRKTIKDLHGRLSETGPTAADRAMRFARAVFNFAAENEDYLRRDGEPLVSVNPVGILKAKRLWNPRRRKSGHITPEGLGRFVEAALSIDPLRWCAWHAHSHRRSDTVTLYLLLMVCLGLRTGEAYVIGQAHWDAKAQELLIADPKNANSAQAAFTVPVGWRLAAMIDRHVLRYPGEWLLANEAGDGPLYYPRAVVEDVRSRGGSYFTPHDLRRTYASILNAMAPAPSQYQIKRLLNHTPDRSDVTTEYIQHDREDLRAIVQRIEDIVFGSITAARPLFV